MGADFKQLTEFTKNIERLNDSQKEEFLESCCKELAARLLAKVIKRTPLDTGTLRRGWTTSATGDSKHDTRQAMYENLFGGTQRVSKRKIIAKKVKKSNSNRCKMYF